MNAFIERKKAQWNTPQAKAKRELLVNSIVVGVATSLVTTAIVAGTGVAINAVANKVRQEDTPEVVEDVN